MMNPKVHHSPYSNINVVIFANRGSMVREVFGGKIETGLLNIANKPILAHVLERLNGLGFDNITIVCLNSEQEKYQSFVASLNNPIANLVKFVAVDGEKTTGDIIRMLPRNTHMLIYPIDLITTVDLTSFVDFHIEQQSALTIFATKYKLNEKLVNGSPGLVQSFQPLGKEFFVYDEANPTKLITILSDDISIKNDIDLNLERAKSEESGNDDFDDDDDDDFKMEISAESLQSTHSMIIDSELKLTNAYLLSPAGINFLKENIDIHSLERQFIPRLCSSQLKASIFTDAADDFTHRIIHYIVLYNINMLCADCKLGQFLPEGEKVEIPGTTQHYYRKGEQKLPEGFRITSGSLYGNNLEVGENTRIGRTVIGDNCVIGENVQMQNCVIGDNVKIGSGSQLRNCMICSDSVIPPKSKITQCFAVPNYVAEQAIQNQEAILKP